ncbi:CubicO group peptidase, beta-lactamase class C family [Actinacidiphila alni]|uniref:CubicO group peptidase, beta-lactamase class C family n=1 Tax=Actinacidiphila alni TaxID=380248 RepID=A0A1I2F5S5_9ACTN|nr:serine hydrolase domain-containing protein [Actinacidiphila alni]SFF00525.1 CubicO group peptidase, beta-lactamase class C family [Actinacidiphila alni]
MAPPLSRGTCPEAGLDTAELTAIVPGLAASLRPAPVHPWCAGAVVLAGRGRTVALHEAVGRAVRYSGYEETADRGVELPQDRQVPMRPDTVFDLASLTKLFTATVAAAHLDQDREVTDYVPEFGAAGKDAITVRQLLDHTSGLRPELPFYDRPTAEERARLLWDEAPLHPPGSARIYSDLNLIAVQHALERATGRPLDVLISEEITGPYGMLDTGFNPPPEALPRIAATEDQRRPWGRLDRGMVHGAVHDENAYAMGGVSGHAGLFSTAWDLALFCRALLDRGGPWPGFETDQPWFMGELAGRGAVGHTGFTGTSLVMDPASDSFLVLLANSVHPSRTWRDGSAPRAAAATRLARAIAKADS